MLKEFCLFIPNIGLTMVNSIVKGYTMAHLKFSRMYRDGSGNYGHKTNFGRFGYHPSHVRVKNSILIQD